MAARAIGDLLYLRISQERTPAPARPPDQPDRPDNQPTSGRDEEREGQKGGDDGGSLGARDGVDSRQAADDFVFTHDDGTPVKDFRGTWAKMFADAGVEMRKLHDMRRSAVRNAIRRGVDRDTVKKMSGHLTDDVFSRYNIQAHQFQLSCKACVAPSAGSGERAFRFS